MKSERTIRVVGSQSEKSDLAGLVSSGRVEVSAHRDSAAATNQVLPPVDSPNPKGAQAEEVFSCFDDVLKVDLEDGTSRWVSVSTLEASPVAVRSAGTESISNQIELGTTYGDVSLRGGGKLIKAVERFALGAVLKEKIWAELKKELGEAIKTAGNNILAAAAARLICRHLESRLVERDGVFKLDDFDSSAEWIPVNKKFAVNITKLSKPLLLMIHGTASSTDGAFVGLGEPDRLEPWTRVAKDTGSYEGVWALNHRTLTISPLENVILLLEWLPAGAELHIVSHSRGGLIGELLCMDPSSIDDLDEKIFEQERANAAGVAALFRDGERTLREFRRYRELLREKKPKVSRFLRIACPALGTTLASERLEAYLSGMANATRFFFTGAAIISGNPAATPVAKKINSTIEFLESCATAFTSQKCNPDVLPGLASMMPTSPLVRFLNRPGRTTSADLTVISGDVKDGSTILQGLMNLVGDLFYLEEHDYVVPTRSMYGGIQRAQGARFYLSEGPVSHHLRYFRNEDTFQALLDGLSPKDSDKFQKVEAGQLKEKSFFEKLKFALRGESVSGDKPVVFLLPGIMGSELSVDDKKLWLDPSALSLGGGFVKKLAATSPGVSATGVLADYYGELVEHLSATHQVIVFPYDWRLSIVDSGARLAEKVRQVASQSKTPIRFLCHSMGGLVARAMMAHGVWQEIKERDGCRIVMLGTPNRGSYSALKALRGMGGALSIIDLLALGDFEHNRATVLGTVHSFDGLIEMMPPNALLKDHWDTLFKRYPKAGALSKPKLEPAIAFWSDLRDRIDTERMIYVAGLGKHTPLQIKSFSSLEFETTTQGDGTVPWSSGKLDGVPSYHVQADHGSLPKHRPAFQGYEDLLSRGRTDSKHVVFRAAPQTWFRGEQQPPLPQETPLLFPTRELMEAAAMGVQGLGSTESLPPSKVSVEVAHGDLRYAKYAVVLGRYEDQPMVGSEKAIDRLLEGRLSTARALGLSADHVGTYRYFGGPAAGQGRGGALIVGLGRYGNLSPGDLTLTVRQGILHYLTERRVSASTKTCGLSFLLIGSAEGGVGLRESVDAILSAVVQANKLISIRASEVSEITHVQFIELFDGRAIDAAHAVRVLCEDVRFSNHFLAKSKLKTIEGGQFQAGCQGQAFQWQGLDITEAFGDVYTSTLQFKVLGNGAANSEKCVELERSLVETYLYRVSSQPTWDWETSSALFEMLIPNGLKRFADDGRSLLLQLDSTTAKFPWELLVDGMSDSPEPLCVSSRMIRQLSTPTDDSKPLNSMIRKALVVGDPPSSLPPLEGAQREAAEVVNVLRNQGYQVESKIRSTGDTVVTKLLSQPYRLLHLSGHGLYEVRPDGRVRAGMVLGDNFLLSPGVFRQVRSCPELVFINCCHLGKVDEIESYSPALAANLATEVMRAGAKAVIAAGWAVEDNCAELFALEFYRSMLGGETFGEAVLQARRAVHQQYPRFNTWGAYQAYGDPDYRLESTRSGFRGGTERAYVAPAEVVAELETLAGQARVCFLDEFERLPAELQNLIDSIPPEWIGRGRRMENEFNASVVASLARTYSQLVHPLLGNGSTECSALQSALKFYKLAEREQALTIDDISIKLRLELLYALHSANLEYEERMEVIDRVLKAREDLITFSSNPKAWSRVGGAAMTALGLGALKAPTVKKLLKTMKKYYEMARHDNAEDDYYYDYHSLCDLVDKWHEAQIDLPARPLEGDTFFDYWGGARRGLLRWIAAGAPDSGFDDVKATLLESWKRGASPFQFKAVLELFDFLIAMCDRSKAAKPEMLDQLITLRKVAVEAVRGNDTKAHFQ